MDKAIQIPECKMCGSKLGQFINPFRIICSSDYIDGWPYCMSCMIEHCVATNCYGCEFNKGDYHNCQFFYMKQNYLEEE